MSDKARWRRSNLLPYNTRMEMNAVAEYIRELSTIEPLGKDEETTLFEQLRGTIGTQQREAIEKRLIESQLSLVASIAEKHIESGIPCST